MVKFLILKDVIIQLNFSYFISYSCQFSIFLKRCWTKLSTITWPLFV